MDPETALATVVKAAEALPTVVKSSFFKAMAKLITGTVDIGVAWTEGKAQGFRDDKEARSLIAREAAAAAAARFKTDPALAERAVNYFGARLLREQSNREKVAAAAAQDLKANPPEKDSESEVSEDWLDMFARFAEGRSEEDVTLYFGKLLAEEIRKPGSFSPATMQVLASMTAATARLFQQACATSATFQLAPHVPPIIFSEPFGSPGQNKLEPFGLNYTNLTDLQASGLLHADLTSWWELPLIVFVHGVSVAKKPIAAIPFPPGGLTPDVQVAIAKPERRAIVRFTPVGLELWRIVHTEPHPAYVEGLLQWVASKLPAAKTPDSNEPGG